MFQAKFGFYALSLEALAWSGQFFGNSNDKLLLLYLIAHAGASAALALGAVTLVTLRAGESRLAFLLLMFFTSFTIPLLGFVAVIGALLILRALPARGNNRRINAVALPEIDVHQRTGKGFQQAGMRSFLSNARAPVANRLRALVALQNVSGRVSSPLLRDVLSDPSDDIRLLAYGMLDNKEKFLNSAIHLESSRLLSTEETSSAHDDATRKLADLYWELVYQELVQGDLRSHALQQSIEYTRRSIIRAPDDASLHLRYGRLLQSLGQPSAAKEAYDRARALGMPLTRIVPYLAEVAYDLGDFSTVRVLMNELGDWQSLPRLKPVIAYWSPK